VKSAAELTKQLLGLARGGKYEVTPTDLNEIIEKSAQMFARTKKEIRIHKKYQDNVALVILDVIMPDMGGGEVYNRLSKFNPQVKVLLSSGYSLDGQADVILKRGCDGFIQKPFTMQALSEKIREIIGKE
jgi:CheY-like chemotaxis protein